MPQIDPVLPSDARILAAYAIFAGSYFVFALAVFVPVIAVFSNVVSNVPRLRPGWCAGYDRDVGIRYCVALALGTMTDFFRFSQEALTTI